MTYRYVHDAIPLTVGRLRLLLAGLDDATPIEVVVPTGSSPECGVGDEPPLILTGGSGDWTVLEDSTPRPVRTSGWTTDATSATTAADCRAGPYTRSRVEGRPMALPTLTAAQRTETLSEHAAVRLLGLAFEVDPTAGRFPRSLRSAATP
ncbi:hypothetical protein [Embleya sp. NBC_00896]|uniref:hypothetical protein n=1 Tax=Embleya sp. NBC_00896 TaxID=2975961 RepID=UPI002F908B34|nr:hypothetical protein OG928_45475 [Embleya sp. NBC_00896]